MELLELISSQVAGRRLECLDTTRFAWGQKVREREREAERLGRRGSRLKKEHVSGQPRGIRHSLKMKWRWLGWNLLQRCWHDIFQVKIHVVLLFAADLFSHTGVCFVNLVAGHGNGIIIRLQWGRRGLSSADTDLHPPPWMDESSFGPLICDVWSRLFDDPTELATGDCLVCGSANCNDHWLWGHHRD